MAVGAQSFSKYYSIFNGKVCRSFKEPTDNTVVRINKEGKSVNEEYYDFIDGVITSINTRDSDKYGKSWLITLQDATDTQILQFPFSCGYSQAFLKCLQNVDLSKSVKLIPSSKEVDGKKKTTLFITQGGHAVKWFYTKDNKHGLPDMVQVKFQGKMKWDDFEQMEFLENMVKTEILPKIGQKAINSPAAAPTDAPPLEPGDGAEPIDDLPF